MQFITRRYNLPHLQNYKIDQSLGSAFSHSVSVKDSAPLLQGAVLYKGGINSAFPEDLGARPGSQPEFFNPTDLRFTDPFGWLVG